MRDFSRGLKSFHVFDSARYSARYALLILCMLEPEKRIASIATQEKLLEQNPSKQDHLDTGAPRLSGVFVVSSGYRSKRQNVAHSPSFHFVQGYEIGCGFSSPIYVIKH